MRGVDAAVFRGLAGKRDQLLGPGIGRRRILERAGETRGPILHGVIDQCLHPGQLIRRGLHIGVAEHHAPHAGSAHIAGKIDAHSLAFQPGKEFAECCPVRLNVQMVVAAAVGRDHRLIQRCGGIAFAGDLGGDSLKDLRRHFRLDQHRQFRLAQHVDEARRDDLALGVDRLFARLRSGGCQSPRCVPRGCQRRPNTMESRCHPSHARSRSRCRTARSKRQSRGAVRRSRSREEGRGAQMPRFA